MVVKITTIMVEVLYILAISTKEIKQGRTSKSLLYECAGISSEKYLKKLAGMISPGIEDALKRLDKLTQGEVRIATAQILKVAHLLMRVRECRGVPDEVQGPTWPDKSADRYPD
jgi:hypothetical protein